MTSRRLVDTNLVVRYLVQDHKEQAAAASTLFEACDRGEFTLVLLPTVIAECVFVLESFYKHAREDIARTLGGLIVSPSIDFQEATVHLDALRRYRDSRLHFVDCLIAAVAVSRNIPVATLDREFGKFPDVRVDLSSPQSEKSP